MTTEAMAYIGIGGASVTLAHLLVSEARGAFNKLVERRAAAMYGARPWSGLERQVATLVAELREIRAESRASAADEVETEDEEEETSEVYDWREDKAILAVATEVVESLGKMGQKKDLAKANVERALNRMAAPGVTHDQLFNEAFKK